MVTRVITFFKEVKSIKKIGFEFVDGFTDVITAGDSDFLTNDAVIDLKVSKNKPNKDHTLQVFLYYLLSLRGSLKMIFKCKRNWSF